MKKTILMAAAVCAILAISSCGGQKTSEPEETEVSVLADSIKEEAASLFNAIKADNISLVESVQQLSDDKKAIPAKFFMPVEAADNAQTLEQKSALLGCYLTDNQTEKMVYGTEGSAERNAVIAKLAAEIGLSSVDSAATKLQDMTITDFEEALANENADCQVTALVYAVVEATLNNQAVYEMQNGLVDDVNIVEMQSGCAPLFTNIVKLVGLLAPHYESLGGLLPLAEKISAILDATDEDSKTVAILEYNGMIREMRGKLNVAVNAD